MGYNIQFQLAGLCMIAVLFASWLSKKRLQSPQNKLFLKLMISDLLVLALDVASVIAIVHMDSIPVLNLILGKAYLVAMMLYLYLIDLYTLSITEIEEVSPKRGKVNKAISAVWTVLLAGACIAAVCLNLSFGGEGYRVYSYGPAASVVYAFSGASVVYIIAMMLANVKRIPWQRQFSVYAFCIMEGLVAAVQMFNQELLIVGFGSALVIQIMYFTLQNPDMDMAAELEERLGRATEISGAMAEKIGDMTGKMEDLRKDLRSTVFSMQTVTAGTSSSVEAVRTQKGKTDEIQACISDVDGISRNITADVQTAKQEIAKGHQSIEILVGQVEKTCFAGEKASEEMRKLTRYAGEMSEIIATIESILPRGDRGKGKIPPCGIFCAVRSYKYFRSFGPLARFG